MGEKKRDMIVGLFVLVGLIVFVWLVFKFGDLPTIVSQYEARRVTIHLPEVPGIQEGSAVLFRGVPVGKVIQVSAPQRARDQQGRPYFRVPVRATIGKEYPVPANVRAKLYRRGLGSSYLSLVLEEPAAEKDLAEGAVIPGAISQGSEFITEETQEKLDQLIGSLMSLSQSMQSQITPRPPELVDQADPNEVRANLTTAVMRLDDTLKNLNLMLGDAANQANFKKGLEEFAALGQKVTQLARRTEQVMAQAEQLLAKASGTLENFDAMAGQAQATLQVTGREVQETADALARTLRHVNGLLDRSVNGEGTMARILNDPRLYETLTDATEQLKLMLQEMRTLLSKWESEGVKMNL